MGVEIDGKFELVASASLPSLQSLQSLQGGLRPRPEPPHDPRGAQGGGGGGGAPEPFDVQMARYEREMERYELDLADWLRESRGIDGPENPFDLVAYSGRDKAKRVRFDKENQATRFSRTFRSPGVGAALLGFLTPKETMGLRPVSRDTAKMVDLERDSKGFSRFGDLARGERLTMRDLVGRDVTASVVDGNFNRARFANISHIVSLGDSIYVIDNRKLRKISRDSVITIKDQVHRTDNLFLSSGKRDLWLGGYRTLTKNPGTPQEIIFGQVSEGAVDPIDSADPSAARFSSIYKIAAAPDGTLYVIDMLYGDPPPGSDRPALRHVIRMIRNDVVTTIFVCQQIVENARDVEVVLGPLAKAKLGFIEAIAVNPADNALYLLSHEKLYKIERGILSLVPMPETFIEIISENEYLFLFDQDGSMYLCQDVVAEFATGDEINRIIYKQKTREDEFTLIGRFLITNTGNNFDITPAFCITPRGELLVPSYNKISILY